MTAVLEPESAAEAVANGAQLLDERMPGWYTLISLERLDLSSCSKCVCGQLAATVSWVSRYWDEHDLDTRIDVRYESFIEEFLAIDDKHYGFNTELVWDEVTETCVEPWRFRDLEAEWKKVITARLEADALKPAREREAAIA